MMVIFLQTSTKSMSHNSVYRGKGRRIWHLFCFQHRYRTAETRWNRRIQSRDRGDSRI